MAEAYGLFNSQASWDELQRSVRAAKDFAEGPSELEVTLHQELARLPDAIRQFHLAQNVPLHYVLEGKLEKQFKFPDEPGKSVAYELEAIFDMLYGIEPANAPYQVEILYLENGQLKRVEA
jgi:hypothetical protein